LKWKRSSLALLVTALVCAVPYCAMNLAGLRESTHVISATGAVDPATLRTGGLYVLSFLVEWTVVPVLLIAAGLAGVLHRMFAERPTSGCPGPENGGRLPRRRSR
jgi:hypothetical protein